MIKCNGCGAIIQEKDDTKMGFVPKINENTKYCMRCYKMIHYNVLPKIIATNDDYVRVIDNLLKKNGLIVYVVDIFQFKNTFREDMIKRLRGKNVILAANKFDIFPHSTNPSKVVEWLNAQCMAKSFKVLATIVVSSKNGLFIKDLVNLIDMFRQEHDVYFVGSANVGKSSLINAIIKDEKSIKSDTISTSVIPGTTLNEINIPFFSDNGMLVDTPGLINDMDGLTKLLPESYEKIMPKTELKPKTYPLTENLALFIGGMVAFEVLEHEKDSKAIIYSSNDIDIHKTNKDKVDYLLQNRLGEVLVPPTKEEKDNIAYDEKIIEFDGKKKKTIWFSGYGFISVIGKAKIKVRYIKGTEVLITNAII